MSGIKYFIAMKMEGGKESADRQVLLAETTRSLFETSATKVSMAPIKTARIESLGGCLSAGKRSGVYTVEAHLHFHQRGRATKTRTGRRCTQKSVPEYHSWLLGKMPIVTTYKLKSRASKAGSRKLRKEEKRVGMNKDVPRRNSLSST
mmetsp:Transcript_18624/g.28016  ORF Transcript_18624/g.28016 Transcript_18624/m.28016 type:complete len:148 (+) Transcript_18624:41-484(+)